MKKTQIQNTLSLHVASRQLRLSRETLRHLNGKELLAVSGGGTDVTCANGGTTTRDSNCC